MGDMVVKSLTSSQHSQDHFEVVVALRMYNFRLNPEKYVFKVDDDNSVGSILTGNRDEYQ